MIDGHFHSIFLEAWHLLTIPTGPVGKTDAKRSGRALQLIAPRQMHSETRGNSGEQIAADLDPKIKISKIGSGRHNHENWEDEEPRCREERSDLPGDDSRVLQADRNCTHSRPNREPPS